MTVFWGILGVFWGFGVGRAPRWWFRDDGMPAFTYARSKSTCGWIWHFRETLKMVENCYTSLLLGHPLSLTPRKCSHENGYLGTLRYRYSWSSPIWLKAVTRDRGTSIDPFSSEQAKIVFFDLFDLFSGLCVQKCFPWLPKPLFFQAYVKAVDLVQTPVPQGPKTPPSQGSKRGPKRGYFRPFVRTFLGLWRGKAGILEK